jgi:putative redox protein
MRTIEVSFPGGKKIACELAGHTVVTDQPSADGGDGTAPSPFDLFMASLATCAGFYAAEFCKRRDISMQGFFLRMCCHKGEQSKRYERIVFELTLPESFPKAQIEALKRSIDSCTVKKHIEKAPAFEVRIAEPAV